MIIRSEFQRIRAIEEMNIVRGSIYCYGIYHALIQSFTEDTIFDPREGSFPVTSYDADRYFDGVVFGRSWLYNKHIDFEDYADYHTTREPEEVKDLFDFIKSFKIDLSEGTLEYGFVAAFSEFLHLKYEKRCHEGIDLVNVRRAWLEHKQWLQFQISYHPFLRAIYRDLMREPEQRKFRYHA